MSVAAFALVAGMLTAIAAPTSASPSSRTHATPARTAARHQARNPYLHGPDTVYRHRSVHVPRTFFGMHDASELAYQHLDFGALRLWDAGVRWQNIETSPGVYDWTRLDSLVEGAQAHHVQVTLVLAMTPSFYASSPNLPPTDLSAYARYVRAVMTRYRDFNGSRGISSYQVWNEGNIGEFWTGTPQQLAQLTAIVDQERNAVDPKATVVAPSFAIRMGYQRRWLSEYQAQRVDGRPVWRYYDVNALSIYPQPTYRMRPGGPEDAMRLVRAAKRRLTEAGVPRTKKLWATEINYGVMGNTATGTATPISQRRQVANVLRTFLLGAANGLSRVFWYRYDWWRMPQGGTLGNTLLSDPDTYQTLTPGGHALRVVERWLSGKLLIARHRWHPCARDHRGTYSCTVRYRKRTRTILWNPLRSVRIRVPAGTARSIVSAKSAYRRSGTRVIRVGYQPVLVHFRK